METIVLCPGCGQENPADREYCLACRSALVRGALVTEEEAQLYWLRRLTDLRRQRIVRWIAYAAVIVAVGLYLYLEVINPVRVGPPVSTIGGQRRARRLAHVRARTDARWVRRRN